MSDLAKKHDKNVQKRKKQLKKIDKNHIAGSVLTFLVTSMLAVTTIVLFAATFMYNTIVDSFENDAKTVKSITSYIGSESDAERAFDAFRGYKDRFLTDKNGNTLLINGSDTCVRNKDVSLAITRYSDEEIEKMVAEQLRKEGIDITSEDYEEFFEEEKEKLEKDEEEWQPDNVIRYYADSSDNMFNLNGNANFDIDTLSSLNIFSSYWKLSGGSIANIIDDTNLSEDEMITFPYWMASQVNSNGDHIFVRSNVEMRRDRLAILSIMFFSFCVVMALMLSIMLINIVSSAISKKYISNLYFTDMVTRGNNMHWFEKNGDDFLTDKKNASSRCAVLNIAFSNYRNLSLSHSPAACEKMLFDVYKELKRFFGKKSLYAHCTTSNFAAVLTVKSEEGLRGQLNMLITELENLSKEHNFVFQIGVDIIDVPVGRNGRPIARKHADILENYNNACAARISLEDSDESGIAFFDEKLLEEQRWINTVNESQQLALQNEEFLVYYQPKYDPRTDRLRGAEALIRWQSPKYGFVTPNRMIPIFEKNGFITEIDHYMISHVARDQKRWLDEGYQCVPVSVNVSRAHFAEPDLAEQIRDMVDKEGAPHELIEIELTESAFFDDKKAMITTIERLKSYGFAVSMDDFGAGYSSLNSLKDMPLDVLKLDAEFFRGEGSGDRGEIVVSEAIRLAKSLHMRTVAEGVEIREQVDFLADQGCDMIQGYFYSKPVPSDEFLEKMKAGISENSEKAAPPPVEIPNVPQQRETVPAGEQAAAVKLEKPAAQTIETDTAKESAEGAAAD